MIWCDFIEVWLDLSDFVFGVVRSELVYYWRDLVSFGVICCDLDICWCSWMFYGVILV